MTLRIKLKAMVLVLLAAAMLPGAASAVGLGRLTVLSALGQPLRADLALSATRRELSSLSASVASPAAFQRAGIEYVPALLGVHLKLERRADGQAFLSMTSTHPINEPFLDVLVQVDWSSGRLLREYTFLLDPPNYRQGPAATAAPVAHPELQAKKLAPSSVEPQKPVMVGGAPAQAAPPPPAAVPATRLVKHGDTLTRIARETKSQDVTLNQMLVALFRNNGGAFQARNMNRMMAGKVLKIPKAEVAAAIDPTQATHIVLIQGREFNAYRRRLAAAVAASKAKKEAAAKQSASGKITPVVKEKPRPAGKGKLEVSKSAPANSAAGASGMTTAARLAAIQEDMVARDNALKEANARIAELQKTVADLKKLVELKNQNLAALQKQAEAAKRAAAVKKPPIPGWGYLTGHPEVGYGAAVVIILVLLVLLILGRRRRHDLPPGPQSHGSVTEPVANSVFHTTGGQSVDTSNSILQTDFSQSGMGTIDSEEGVDPVAEADVYMAYGRDAQAEEILLEALKTDPNRQAVRLKLLEIYAARKNLKQFQAVAGELYQQTGGAGPDWAKAEPLIEKTDPENPLYGKKAPVAEPETPAVEPPATPAAQDDAPLPGELEDVEPGSDTQPLGVPGIASPMPESPPASLGVDLDLEPAQAAETAAAEEAAEEVGTETLVIPSREEAAPKPEDDQYLDLELQSTDVAGRQGAQTDEAAAAPGGTAPATEEEAMIELEKSDAMAGKPLDFSFDFGTETAPSAVQPERVDLSNIDLDLEATAPTAPTAPAGAPLAGEAAHFAEAMAAATSPEEDRPVEAPAAEVPSAEAQPAPAAEAPPQAPADEARPAEPAPARPAAEPPPVAEARPAEVSPPSPPASPTAPEAHDATEEVATKLELAQAYEEMGDKEGARELLQEVIQEGNAQQQARARAKLAELS